MVNLIFKWHSLRLNEFCIYHLYLWIPKQELFIWLLMLIDNDSSILQKIFLFFHNIFIYFMYSNNLWNLTKLVKHQDIVSDLIVHLAFLSLVSVLVESLTGSACLCNSLKHFLDGRCFQTSNFFRFNALNVWSHSSTGHAQFLHQIWEAIYVNTGKVQVFAILILCGCLKFVPDCGAQSASPEDTK